VSCAKLKANEVENGEALIRKEFDLGKEHAREWLNNPQGKPLAMLRLEYQDNLTDSIKWGIQTNQKALIKATAILDMVSMYSAGIDQALDEFIFLVQTKLKGAYQ
jgi:hypothetical protein